MQKSQTQFPFCGWLLGIDVWTRVRISSDDYRRLHEDARFGEGHGDLPKAEMVCSSVTFWIALVCTSNTGGDTEFDT